MKKIIIATICAIPAICLAEPLWGKVEAGATLAEIRSAYPQGSVIEPTDKDKIKSGAALRYVIKEVPVVGENFQAKFFLMNEKLEQVTLSLVATKSEFECSHTTDAVLEALKAKYGEPVKKSKPTETSDYSWTSGKTTVSLFGMNLPTVQSCTVYIFYNQRIATSSNNL